MNLIRVGNKRGGILNQVIIHIVLVGIIFALFLMATAGKINGRGVKQQVLEKEIALLIDSAEPGMEFSLTKDSVNGYIQKIEIKDSRVHVAVEGMPSLTGYPYFSRYVVSVRDEVKKWVISVE